MTPNYEGDVEKAIQILNEALATEVVCVLRYKYHAVAARGIHSETVKGEFAQHARDEEQHAELLAERINQLGGNPNFNPEGLLTRSATEYVEGSSLMQMIEEDLVAERIAVETYRSMILDVCRIRHIVFGRPEWPHHDGRGPSQRTSRSSGWLAN